MSKIYPLPEAKILFKKRNQTFAELGIPINPSLEGVDFDEEMLKEKTKNGQKKLLSLEFNWLPSNVVNEYNSAKGEINKKKILVGKVYGNCRLNCKGCYVKQDNLFKGKSLIDPKTIINLIEEAVTNLGTKTIKYLGPSEFFRDKNVFEYLKKLDSLGIIINIFAKDPMFGDDTEAKNMFGHLGIKTAGDFVRKLAQYKNLRILYNFKSFDEEITNDSVRGGYIGKEDYDKNYKKVQTKSLKLLYKYFVKRELDNNRPSRVIILNTPIVENTIKEAFEIFRYFTDKGIPVCSTTSMQSGCGSSLYKGFDKKFISQLAKYYAQAIKYSIERGLFSQEDLKKYGPSPYAGIDYCVQLCSGILIRENGMLFRCPGADHDQWYDYIEPVDLIKDGLVKTWPKTKNYQQKNKLNIGCLAKPKVFNKDFNKQILENLNKLG